MNLNDKIIAYLAQNNILATPGDYSTGQPAGQADQIITWNTVLLGVQPSQAVLDAAVMPPAVPTSVTMRQARLALLAAGMLPTVDAAVISAGSAAKIEWDYAQEVKRDWPLVLTLQPILGLTDLQLDALFIAAAKL